MSYYSLKQIHNKHATYNIIIGERSNGKTYATLKQCLLNYKKDGSQMGYVRRWKEDVTGRRASNLFASLNSDKTVSKIFPDEFETVHYINGKFYLANYGDDGKVIYSDQDIIGHCFAISDGEHDKSTSYPLIKTIVFDEFITNRTYLPDEFVLFMNVVSTIVRRRDDVKVYMLGNTVNKYCPYFQEMGLINIEKQKQGSIDVYKYGDSSLTVAVEYCSTTVKDKKSNKYFAFNNPKLDMITGGAWELNIYPHLPMKYKPKDILMIYYIEFNGQVYQCEIILIGDITFTYIHNKTTPIRKPEKHFIYSLDQRAEYNYNMSIYRPINRIQEKILWYFKMSKVFYQDNVVGDAISNYLKVCK